MGRGEYYLRYYLKTKFINTEAWDVQFCETQTYTECFNFDTQLKTHLENTF